MSVHSDSGWTMDQFIEWAFGPERVLEMVQLVDDVQQLVARLVASPANDALRRAVRRQMHELRDLADAHNWRHEGDVAAALVDLPVVPHDVRLSVQEVRAGLSMLHHLVQGRLAHSIALTRRAA